MLQQELLQKVILCYNSTERAHHACCIDMAVSNMTKLTVCVHMNVHVLIYACAGVCQGGRGRGVHNVARGRQRIGADYRITTRGGVLTAGELHAPRLQLVTTLPAALVLLLVRRQREGLSTHQTTRVGDRDREWEVRRGR